jgi:DNA-binding Lrp family transcriptional regulator
VSWLDLLDRKIVIEMIGNCRITYQDLADKVGLTANAVKKRVSRLVDSEVLIFDVALSYANSDANPILIMVQTDESRTRDEFTQLFCEQSGTFVVTPLLNNGYVLLADAKGVKGLSETITQIRLISGIQILESHILLTNRGNKTKFKKAHLRVLRCLLEDARMPFNEISSRCGLTTRRVSRYINELMENQGISFMARWNPNMGRNDTFFIKIEWNPQKTDIRDLIEWLMTDFSDTFWLPYISASEPVVFALFIVEHMRYAEDIGNRIRADSRVANATTLIPYPSRLMPRPRHVWLEEMLTEAGF